MCWLQHKAELRQMVQGFDPAVSCMLEPGSINAFDYCDLVSVHLCHGWLVAPPCGALVPQWLIAPALD